MDQATQCTLGSPSDLPVYNEEARVALIVLEYYMLEIREIAPKILAISSKPQYHSNRDFRLRAQDGSKNRAHKITRYSHANTP